MKLNLTKILVLSSLTLGLGACMHDGAMYGKHPGKYVSSETSTDANGTTTVKESTSEVTVDEYGNKKETISTKVTKDPKGLMNKTSKKTTQTIQEK